jgi:hypothetical protein
LLAISEKDACAGVVVIMRCGSPASVSPVSDTAVETTRVAIDSLQRELTNRAHPGFRWVAG